MSEQNVAVVRELYETWARGDFSRRDTFHPQVEFARIGGEGVGQDGEWRGLDEMWGAIVEWLGSWEAVRVEADRFADLGDRVLVLAHQSGRGKRSGVPFDFQYGELFTLRDGRIVRWELYIDRAEALEAAGLEG